MSEVEEAQELLYRANEKLQAAHREVKAAELALDTLTQQATGALPKEPGWYVDAADCIWRLNDDNRWDDGWGNSGPEYAGFPEAPLTHLVEETRNA